jgi:ketosteroid isomerase-like protein
MSSVALTGLKGMSIEELIRRWVAAAHTGPVEAVVAHHAADIVMFDVPPPHRGVRGLEAYRRTWPGFLEWQSAGAVFQLEELDVTEGEDVAFAWALVRCGTTAGFAEDPERRLRLTVGLERDGDGWTVTHEHHSFADTSTTPV